MTKKITMQTRPNIKPTAEDWVENKTPQPPSSQEAIKRLTVGIGETLHRKLKIYCATEGTDIATVVRDLISGKLENAS